MQVAFLEQSRKTVREDANLVRKFLRPFTQDLEELDERAFNRSQDSLFERLGRSTFGEIPAERQPIGELVLGILVSSFATGSYQLLSERAVAVPRKRARRARGAIAWIRGVRPRAKLDPDPFLRFSELWNA